MGSWRAETRGWSSQQKERAAKPEPECIPHYSTGSRYTRLLEKRTHSQRYPTTSATFTTRPKARKLIPERARYLHPANPSTIRQPCPAIPLVSSRSKWDELATAYHGRRLHHERGPGRKTDQLLNEWVILSRSSALIARGKVFEARDEVLSLLNTDEPLAD